MYGVCNLPAYDKTNPTNIVNNPVIPNAAKSESRLRLVIRLTSNHTMLAVMTKPTKPVSGDLTAFVWLKTSIKPSDSEGNGQSVDAVPVPWAACNLKSKVIIVA